MSKVVVRCAALACVLSCALPAAAQGKKGVKKPADLNNVSLDVEALQALNALELSPAQLTALSDLAKDAGDKRQREPAKAGAKWRAALVELRNALAKGDDEKAGDATAKLDEAADEGEQTLDDDVKVTDLARQRAGKLLKLLTARQLAAWVPTISVDDPVELLADSLEDAREAENKEEFRTDVAADVVAYLPAERAEAVRAKVVAFLKKAQELNGADFKAKLAKLADEAAAVVGEVDPVEVLRRSLERAAAELLSNPRLENAIRLVRQRKQ